MPHTKLLLAATLSAACLLNAHGQAPAAPATAPVAEQKVLHPSAEYRKTLDDLFNKHVYDAQYPAGSEWLDGGARYTALEPSTADPTKQDKKQDLVAYDTVTGARSVLVPAASFVPAGATAPLDLSSYTWSSDKRQLLLFTNTQRVWRANTRGDYWVLNLDTNKLRRLGEGLPAASLMFAKFSPDGKLAGYVSGNNLYVEDVATGTRRQLTNDGSSDIINGTTDWVTEEEFALRDAFRWSPDSKRIAFLQFDQSGESDYTLINDTKTRYPETFHYKYPQAGTNNAYVRAGVVPADASAAPHWLELPGDPRNNYVPSIEWTGAFAPAEITLQYINRRQNQNDVYLFNADTGTGKVLFTDRDDAWVEPMDGLRWMPSQKAGEHDLLWISERDGWRHAYRISPDGKPHLLTDFPADVIDTVAVDEPGGYLYFTASPDALRQYLYRARLDGKGKPERLTPEAQVGFHRYGASPDGKVALHSWSSATQPAHFDLMQLADGKVLKPLADNAALATKIKPMLDAQPKEFFQVPVLDGTKLNAFMVKPPNFDPSRKYPVLVYVYGEPADSTVHDGFSGQNILQAAMAREGYIVVSFDNAGTPQPRGRAWRKSIYGSVGVLSSQQQAEAIRELGKERPYIDMSRLAVWGWSGGGSMTLNMMFRFPGLFQAGIAVAPVADETRYDTIYQERYMGLPQVNVKGYHDGSPITWAAGLTGSLLIVHGSGDDNVHFQATELLVNRLIELGKQFDFMDYPNRTHGIYEGPGTTPHIYTLIQRYLEDHVPAGPM